jgi:hypothetical protein
MCFMKTIVTGKFAAEKQAARAVDKLLNACIRGDHVRAFLLNRPGRPLRRGAERRAQSWRIGRTAEDTVDDASAAVELEVGPAAVADGVQVSAYAGNLSGADEGARRMPQHTARIIVAVETSNHVAQALAVNVLREHGARAIERSAGAWQEGQRADLHPVAISSLLEQSDQEPPNEDLPGITRH